MNRPKILVLCTGNSARSQMAEGIIRYAVGDRVEVYSAGTKPSLVRPEAIKAMAEIGIDISHHRSKSVDEFNGQRFEFVLTVCDNARENCPYFPAATKLIHHAFEDPADVVGDEEDRVAAFRRVRENIVDFVKGEFLAKINDV